MFRALQTTALVIAITLIPGIAATSPAHADVPSQFSDTLLTNVQGPTALAFTPDGRMLITGQLGILHANQGGSTRPRRALTIPDQQICTQNERGLLGVAVDPNFATNQRIFLYYTFERPDGSCVNRVSRFILPESNLVDPAGEVVLIDNIPSPAANHNAGDLAFGRDGYLYISVGDGGCDYAGDSGCAAANDAARDLHALVGKILRITADGEIPRDNPFLGAGSVRCNRSGTTTAGSRCREIFASGLRNPFRIAFDPNAASARFFINDVGQNAREEIDVGRAGADYGWNCLEGTRTNSTTGKCSPTPSNLVAPIFEYTHDSAVPGTRVSGCRSITGGAFVPNGLWPGFDGAYLFGDFGCDAIFQLKRVDGGWSASEFASGLGSVIHLVFGPHGSGQALYYTTYDNGGQVRRIARRIGGGGATCFGKVATIVGAGEIAGTPGNDVIVGSAGGDLISGGGGDDLICAGDGDDVVNGGTGRDRINGGRGRDLLRGQGDDDRLLGGPDDDRLRGGTGRDRLDGGQGTDGCLPGAGDALVSCESNEASDPAEGDE